MKLFWQIVFLIFVLCLVGFCLWLYWLVASWFVDSVIGVRDIEGFALKVVMVFAIIAVLKALEGIANLGKKAS